MSLDTSAGSEFLSRQFEHGFEQSDLRLPNCKLRCVNADRQSARACGDIVAEERALSALIELAPRIQRQRTGRNHQPGAESRAQLFNTCHPAPRSGSVFQGFRRRVSPSPQPIQSVVRR